MKGIVFTEFLEMVEEKFGYEMVDHIISEGDLPSGGSYTSVGTYSHAEMVQLIVGLSKKTKRDVPSLLKAFALYFFDTLEKTYPQFLEATDNAFDFLESIENYIHVEVRKLYPDAELPTFETKLLADDTLEMIYTSERAMSDFAEGLMERAIGYYGESATIVRKKITEDGKKVQFVVTKN